MQSRSANRAHESMAPDLPPSNVADPAKEWAARGCKGYSIELHVITYDRLNSLKRLISSLERAHYFGQEVHLSVHVEANPPKELLRYLEDLEWKHGTKYLSVRVIHGGLVVAVAESWYPTTDDEYAVLLEDDVEVSPYFYQWLIGAVCYHRLNPDPSVFGVSLHPHRVAEVAEPRRVVEMDAEVERLSVTPYMPYYLQLPCSWGAMYFPRHWRAFRKYMDSRNPNATFHIDGSLTMGWQDSWKKYYIEFAYANDYFMMYPNFPSKAALSKNHLEVGKHVTEEDLKWRRKMYDVNLIDEPTLVEYVSDNIFKGAEDTAREAPPRFNMFSEPYWPLDGPKPPQSPCRPGHLLGFTGQPTEALAAWVKVTPPGNKMIGGYMAVVRLGGPILISLPQRGGEAAGSFWMLHAMRDCSTLSQYSKTGESMASQAMSCSYSRPPNATATEDHMLIRLDPNGTLVANYYKADVKKKNKLAWVMDTGVPDGDFYIQLHTDGEVAAYDGCGPCHSLLESFATVSTRLEGLERDNSTCTPGGTRSDVLRSSHILHSGREYDFSSVNGSVKHSVRVERSGGSVVTTTGPKNSVVLGSYNFTDAKPLDAKHYTGVALSLHHMGVLLLRARNATSRQWEDVWRSGGIRSYPQHFMWLDPGGSLGMFEGFTPCSAGRKVWAAREGGPEDAAEGCHSPTKVEQLEVCGPLSQELYNLIDDRSGMTILISTFSEKRKHLLDAALRHYSRSPVVRKIAIVWHSATRPRPRDGIVNGKPVHYLGVRSDSLNNRFRPSMLFSTGAVATLDDDMLIHLDDLSALFEAWKQEPDKIAGFFPRWFKRSKEGKFQYLPQSEDPKIKGRPVGYPLMLTKAMVLHKKYLYEYFCGVGRQFHARVDELLNGEDISMNFMVANFTGEPAALFVLPEHRIADFGTSIKGDALHLKRGHSHNSGRNDLLTELSAQFGWAAGPQLNARYAVAKGGTAVLADYEPVTQRHHENCMKVDDMQACVGWGVPGQGAGAGGKDADGRKDAEEGKDADGDRDKGWGKDGDGGKDRGGEAKGTNGPRAAVPVT